MLAVDRVPVSAMFAVDKKVWSQLGAEISTAKFSVPRMVEEMAGELTFPEWKATEWRMRVRYVAPV
jgi:hypothetical protein